MDFIKYKESVMSNKLDFQGIVDSVKSVLNPDAMVPEAEKGDKVAEEMVAVMLLLKEMGDEHNQLGQKLATLNHKLHSLYKLMHVEEKAEEKPKDKPKDEPKPESENKEE